MKPFSLLIKPASADCNLRCEYCFYLDRCALYPGAKVHRMGDGVLDQMVRSFMATQQDTYAFGWQGGEPTLMGLDFFQRVTDLQKKHGRRGAVVANGLQTNATLIDDAFARHLAEYNFLVGVSLDGPPEVHDHYRKTGGGRGSHEDVMRGIGALKRNRAEFNILVLVNDLNAARPREAYRYLRDQGFLFHQYIPCVEFDETGRLLPYSVSGERWGDFLCGVFDEWMAGDVRKVSVRLFDSVLTYLVEGTYNVCHMGRDCRQYFVVEYNGDVYPCDFFVDQGLLLGNVMEDEWGALQASQKYAAFGAKKARWSAACERCEWLKVCSGDCLKHRHGAMGNPGALSVLCEGWRRFCAHAMPGLEKLAGEIREERRLARLAEQRRAALSTPAAAPPGGAAPGRNAPCPCGSGRKFKNCCMARR